MLILGRRYEFSLVTDTTNIQDYVTPSKKGRKRGKRIGWLVRTRNGGSLLLSSVAGGHLRYSRLGEPAEAVGAQRDFSEDKGCFILSEPGAHFVAQAGLQLEILLPQPPKH